MKNISDFVENDVRSNVEGCVVLKEIFIRDSAVQRPPAARRNRTPFDSEHRKRNGTSMRLIESTTRVNRRSTQQSASRIGRNLRSTVRKTARLFV